jgi:PAS domain S-box-containing protein
MSEVPDNDELLDELRSLRHELAQLRQGEGDAGGDEVRYRAVVDNVIDGIITIDAQGVIESFNPAAERIFGYTPEDVIGHNVRMLMPAPYHDEHDAHLDHYHKTGEAQIIGIGREVTGRRKDGSEFPMDLAVGEFVEAGHTRFTGVLRDITRRKQLEEQLLQAQKMESVGQLAGGVAHDFNNQLGIILFDVDMLLAAVDDEATQGDLQKIRKTVLRAADLTRQLLVFSRRQRMEPQALDLNQHLGELRKMMTRLLGEDVDIRLELTDDPCTIEADPGNLDQVLINLCVNARDAMPEGGILRISTDSVLIDETYAREHSRGVPGRYCRLTVADEGHGMEENVKARVFEPFFTTKDTGKGTGLGLSVVYGIIETHKGWITVDSKPDLGTRFQIFLPTIGDAPDTSPDHLTAVSTEQGHNEAILVIEDNSELRQRLVRILTTSGYLVSECADLASARRVFEQGAFDLVLSDVVLPDGRGPDFCLELLDTHPELHVILLTGYSDGRGDSERLQQAGCPVLRKPVGVTELLEQVRRTLDGS